MVVLLATAFASTTAVAQMKGQVDDFEDGTPQGWGKGSGTIGTVIPPSNMANGGPNGAGDNYLQNISTGGFGANSRMSMFNSAQ